MLKVDNICQSLNGFWLPVTLSGERQDTLSAGSTPRWVMATCFLALWLPLHSVWHSASWSAKLLPSDSVSSHLSHATKSWPLKSDVSWSFCTVPPLGPRNRVPDPPLWFLRANQSVCCCPCWRQTKDIQWKRPKQKGNQVLVRVVNSVNTSISWMCAKCHRPRICIARRWWEMNRPDIRKALDCFGYYNLSKIMQNHSLHKSS